MADLKEGESLVGCCGRGTDMQRSAVVVNGQTPGPLITANKGDSLQVCHPTLPLET